MDGYGVQTQMPRSGTSRYRVGDEDAWDLTEAEGIAYGLLVAYEPNYVTFGNGEHEFRAWAKDVTYIGNFTDTHTGPRWSQWYVDVEIDGHRWVYRPVADLDDHAAANALAELAATLHPDVTRIWVGESDGACEFETVTAES